MYQRILLAYDGSESGQKALLDCHDIAQWSKAELFLIAVRPLPAAPIGIEGGFFDGAREEEEKQRYHTLSGMLMLLLGRLPHTGDLVQWDGWSFEIVDIEQRPEAAQIVERQRYAAADQAVDLERPAAGIDRRIEELVLGDGVEEIRVGERGGETGRPRDISRGHPGIAEVAVGAVCEGPGAEHG